MLVFVLNFCACCLLFWEVAGGRGVGVRNDRCCSSSTAAIIYIEQIVCYLFVSLLFAALGSAHGPGRDTVGVAPLPPSSRSDAFTANTIENLIYPTSGLRDDGGVVTTRTFCEMLRLSSTDGIVVLADGRLVYERYFGAFTANDLHVQFSNTKTCLSLIAAHLVASGQLDLRRRVCDYIPELPASSGFGEALVEHVLDMTTTIVYEEKYNLAPSEFLRNIEAAGYLGDNFSSLFEVRRKVAPSVTPRS